MPANTLADFIAYVKDNPGKVNLASSGNGTSVHLSGELFMAMTGAKMLHVPYKGAAPAITDLLGNRVQVIFDNMPSIIGHIQSGSVRALAVTTATRSPELPDVPTVAETVPGYEASALFGMGAPKKTPPEIVAKLNKEINAVLAEPEVRKRLIELGGEPLISTPEAFGAMIVAETEKWEKVVKFASACGSTLDPLPFRSDTRSRSDFTRAQCRLTPRASTALCRSTKPFARPFGPPGRQRRRRFRAQDPSRRRRSRRMKAPSRRSWFQAPRGSYRPRRP